MHMCPRSLLATALLLSLAACKPTADGGAAPTAVTTPEPVAAQPEAMRAFGNEPFWTMLDKGDGTLEFSTPDMPVGEHFTARRHDDAAGIHYAGAEVVLDIVKQACSDGMSDVAHAFAATMTLRGVRYAGCAAPAAAGPAEAAAVAEGPITRFKANGFSPAWRAEVDGETVRLDMPEHGRVDPGFTTVPATRSAYSKGVEFTGRDGDVEFTLNIDGRMRCNKAGDEDGRLDREFGATLQYGKVTYKGCADAVK